MSGANNNWAVQTQGLGAAGTGANAYGAGGDPTAIGTGAQRLDMLRMGAGQTPEAQYPDGYLGQVNNRYSAKNAPQDTNLQTRMTDRSYQRGVHKDVKMPSSAYLWPTDFGPDSGLKLESRGKLSPDGTILVPRFGPPGNPVDRYNSGMSLSEREMTAVYQRYGLNSKTGQGTDSTDPARVSVLRNLAPPMSW
jgi:hypothetical protein